MHERYRSLPGSSGSLRVGEGSTVSDLDLEGYRIVGAQCRAVHDPRRRPVLRNISLRACAVEDSVLEGARVEDCAVEGLVLDAEKVNQVRACSFRRVVLAGDLSHLRDAELSRVYARANAEVWLDLISTGDWALDISRARHVDLWPGIPSRLIRRDTETQVVVAAAGLAGGAWRGVEPINRRIFSKLSRLERSGFRDGVIIAERGAADFDAQMSALVFLRDAGLTEDDTSQQ